MTESNDTYLILGTNLGDKHAHLRQAIQLITQYIGSVTLRSAVYETEPWGMSQQPGFYNQVLKVVTSLNAEALLEKTLWIEQEMGRVRAEKFGARIIDIDILFFNNEVLRSERLTVPHPRISERNFVLVPLAEIATHIYHPVLHQTVGQLLRSSVDTLAVSKATN